MDFFTDGVSISGFGSWRAPPRPGTLITPTLTQTHIPNQRPIWLVCELAVVHGKAPFGVRAHLRIFTRHGGSMRTRPTVGHGAARRVNPFRTVVSFWGRSTQILSSLSPKRDCSPKRVKRTRFYRRRLFG